eukprot:1848543-Pleurochrysis_carterae.AAC.1
MADRFRCRGFWLAGNIPRGFFGRQKIFWVSAAGLGLQNLLCGCLDGKFNRGGLGLRIISEFLTV